MCADCAVLLFVLFWIHLNAVSTRKTASIDIVSSRVGVVYSVVPFSLRGTSFAVEFNEKIDSGKRVFTSRKHVFPNEWFYERATLYNREEIIFAIASHGD